MKKIVVIICLFILLGCSSKEAIRIGTNSWPPCEIWSVAQKEGFFDNTPVTIVRFSTWSDNMKALYRGDIDITHGTFFNAVYYSDKGVPGKIILTTETIEGGDGLVLKKGLKVKDLKGKRIAVELNTDEHFLLYKALIANGININDVSLISTTSYDAAKLFINEEVSACFTYEPFLSQAAVEGEGAIVWTTKDAPGYMMDTLIASNEIIDKRQKDIQNVLKAWYKTIDYLEENPESFNIMSKNEDMDVESFISFYNSFIFFSKDYNKNIFNSSDFENKLSEIGNFLYENGSIIEIPEVSELYSKDIINNF